MVEGLENKIGEPVRRVTDLMLGDVLHFTTASLESNRTRNYRVIELKLLGEEASEGELVVDTESDLGGRVVYRFSERRLKDLGAELVYTRME